MKDDKKTKKELIQELQDLRARVSVLEAPESDLKGKLEELQESDRRYRALFDNPLTLLYVNDAQGVFRDANDSALELLGYTRDELGQVSFGDIVHPEDYVKALERQSQEFSGGRPEGPLELRLLSKSGEQVWVEAYGYALGGGGEEWRALGVAHDITDRKRAEEALQSSEEYYRLLADNVTDVIWTGDMNLRTTYISPSITHQRGYTVEEAMAHTIHDMMPLDHVERMTQALAEELAADEAGQGPPEGRQRVEVELYCKDGSKIWAEVHGRLLRDSEGKIVGILGVTRDITERKQAEEALRESEERFSKAFHSSPSMLAITKMADGRIVDVNQSFVRTLGYSWEELVGHTTVELGLWVDPKERDRFANAVKEHKLYHGVEVEIRTKSGETVLVLLSGEMIELGGEPHLITIASDISQRKAAEEALRESEDRYRRLFEKAPASITVTDASGRVVDCNPATEALTGYSSKEIVGKSFDELLTLDPKDLPMVRKKHEMHLQGREIVEPYELEVFRKDGERRTIGIRSALLAKDDLITGIQVFATDITERKQAEQTLQMYSERLEEMVEARTEALRDAQEQLARQERLAMLGQLAGSVSHELRNPLAAIKNAAYFLDMALEDPDPEVKETLRILEAEVAVSDRIIESLLEFARPKPGVWQGLEINDLIQHALSRTTVPENIEVVCQLDESLPEVLGDADQIGQVFGNILLNSIQAMTEGGQLVIKSEAPNPQRVSVSFADAGGGIPEDRLGKIFDPLFTTKARGIGLGLALSKSIVERHGGTIEVQSKAGEGSTFTVGLPVGGGEWGSKADEE